MRSFKSFLALAGILVASLAMSPVTARAACYATAQALPSQDVDAFLADKDATILKQNPDGGPAMITKIRDLAASNPATLPIIIGLLTNPNANANQKTAIGTGLGQAAQICVRTDQAYAAEIQRLVAASGSNEAIIALAAVIGDRPIGALGGGGGGGGGGGVSGGAGGPINSFSAPAGGSGALQTFGTSGTRNSFTSFTVPGSASAGSVSTTTTTNTTIVRSVSP